MGGKIYVCMWLTVVYYTFPINVEGCRDGSANEHRN